MSESEAVPNETPQQRSMRLRKSVGGVMAGVMIGYFGYERVIHWFDVFTMDDAVLVAIALTVTGEHVFRWLMNLGPQVFDKVALGLFNRRGP